MDQEEIKLQAKEIMDKFMTAMKDIEVEEDFVLEREECIREEGEGEETDEAFRQKFLSNAPHTKGDAIITEKGEWVE